MQNDTLTELFLFQVVLLVGGWFGFFLMQQKLNTLETQLRFIIRKIKHLERDSQRARARLRRLTGEDAEDEAAEDKEATAKA